MVGGGNVDGQTVGVVRVEAAVTALGGLAGMGVLGRLDINRDTEPEI